MNILTGKFSLLICFPTWMLACGSSDSALYKQIDGPAPGAAGANIGGRSASAVVAPSTGYATGGANPGAAPDPTGNPDNGGSGGSLPLAGGGSSSTAGAPGSNAGG